MTARHRHLKLSNSMYSLRADISTAVRNLVCERCSKNKRRQVVPSTPKTALPTVTAPGTSGHADTGLFESPYGPFAGLVHVNAFLAQEPVQIFPNKNPTGEQTAEVYPNAVCDAYEECVFDAGTTYDFQVFKDFLQQSGSTYTPVPIWSHWFNKPENGVPTDQS